MIQNKLTDIEINGFKSLVDVRLKPGNINVFIGTNAAGKSNFIHFFRMLSFMLAEPNGRLQEFVGRYGGANHLLFLNQGEQISARLEITTPKGYDEYKFTLARTANDTLFFKDEAARFTSFDDEKQLNRRRNWFTYRGGHYEAKLLYYRKTSSIAKVITYLFRNLTVYQFHNTAEDSYLRSKARLTDSYYLRANGANLAAYMYKIKQYYPDYFQRIIIAVRQIIPDFDTFVLEPEYGRFIYLRWKERNPDYIFDASQASDGFLRAVALIVLLLQPLDMMPSVLFIDEPELGLHPEAIEFIASLMKKVSNYRQLFISTQSPLLVSQFEPEDIIVVERKEGITQFNRLDEAELKDWLNEYSLGEKSRNKMPHFANWLQTLKQKILQL